MSKIRLTLKDIFNLPTAVIYNPDNFKTITSVIIDSRIKRKNNLFVAIKGEKFDGHNFVKDAVKNGSSAIVIDEKKYKNFENINIPIITVKNTTKALGDLAGLWRDKINTKVIAITGSSGKTSTKEMLAQLLHNKYKVNKTLSNNNNHIGVPLTLLNTNRNDDYLVLELGSNHYGEIEYSSKIANPNYALITNIGNSHLQYFKDKEGVLKEKISLFRITNENNGVVFVNNNDASIKKASKNIKNKITFGLKNKSDYTAFRLGKNKKGNEIVEILHKKRKYKFELPLIGMHNINNFVAASAIALELGLSKKDISNGLKNYKAEDKRFIINTYKDTVVIDDTYNANPDSTKYAIETLAEFDKQFSKVVVLGDMLELGKNSIKLHKDLSKQIIKSKINEVYTIGNKMKHLSNELKKTKKIVKHFSKRENLEKFLNNKSFQNVAVLVKGSRGMKMEEFVKVIKNGITE